MLVVIGLTSRSDFVETENESAVFTTMMGPTEPLRGLSRPAMGADFIGVEVPKEFVEEVLDAATEAGQVTDEATANGYRLRVL